ncbi:MULTISPECIES: response regulator [Methylobacter]|jgi:Transcriptional regulatory protein, C terminal./Response regulator receiver domain.|uniref:Two component transcriptional regulator, winged helix family n=2 Tax=Methylobacter tundripaludum TaxID=173365 RepID=G3IXU7_METTV|nr:MULTISPECIES: response regulator [Methylobacter]EGW23506.1 two component transcriptional regulator, winged helix family [Methylobacter tundripaludum SV96]MDD4905614.1 response regulator [Methylobacter tundripaludum]MDI1277663.1 response regulator [Methylobacter sp.]MDI1358193.1 response regulator [Methylobacter sp.]PPK77936.1 two-component system OmpR family response regulator/two-component system response regulator QseB [Methylobacter tundripaludum]
MRLLLVEDDEILGEGLVEGLKMEGYAVDWLTNGKLADEALKINSYELIVLDLNLPDMEGLDILKALRTRKDETPVMVLTAKDTVPDRVLGLDSGADDFVIKPFELDEVCARLRALARRNEGRSVPNIEYKGIVLDPASHQVTWNDEKVDLSQKEFEILSFLMSNIGRVISRARLEESLYSWDSDVESNTVEVHIHHLRKKLDPSIIRTVRGVGYIIDED